MRGKNALSAGQRNEVQTIKRLHLPGFRRLTTIDRTLKEAKSNEI